MNSESKIFSGTAPLKLRPGKSTLIRRGGEICFCSEAKGGIIEFSTMAFIL
jgi:hypothetical protein